MDASCDGAGIVRDSAGIVRDCAGIVRDGAGMFVMVRCRNWS